MRMLSLIFVITCASCAWNDLKAVVHGVIQRILVELHVTRTAREIMLGRETCNRNIGFLSQG